MHAYLARYAPDLYSGTINPKPTDVWGPLNSDKVVEKYVGRMQTLSGPLGTLLVLWGADGSPQRVYVRVGGYTPWDMSRGIHKVTGAVRDKVEGLEVPAQCRQGAQDAIG